MARRRFLYTLGGQPILDDEGKPAPIEISDDVELAPRRAAVGTEGITYSNLRALDGTDTSTKRRHREYMKANGVAMASDFKESLPIARERRVEKMFGRDQQSRKARREAIGRAVYELEKRGRK